KKSKGGLKKRDLTPSRNPNFSGIGEGDRFIPKKCYTIRIRKITALSIHISQSESLLNLSSSAPNSPSKAEREMKIQLMRAKSANEMNGNEERILCYKKGQAPPAPFGHMNQPKVLYTNTLPNPSGSVRKGLRHIPTSPERILDAPNYMDDYYLNLIDWSNDNVIAVALTYSLYLWNAGTGEIDTLFDLPEERGVFITSVRWAGEGSFLAVGLSDGQIRLFDPTRANAMLRTMHTQINRVGCLAWRHHILSAGCRSGRIHHHDVRVAAHHVGRFENHTQEVCGLQWSPDGRYLASGGGDNVVNVWDSNMITADEPSPIYTFCDHLASVKAIAFNPQLSNSLATGGGTADRTIKFYNLSTGTLCHSEQTDSQVNAIAFSKHYKEIITAHGYPNNLLKIWKYPSMRCIQDLTGHTERVLGLTMSPCGQFVMSASGDESLRLWWCFKVDKNAKSKTSKKTSSCFAQSVR
uniref:Anaphase-promoting complex subunit 4-like WD40 domain-containing protein n=1 Tax=Parascaris univalens TaxID=6257 RepID=A0A915CKH7_PARUN